MRRVPPSHRKDLKIIAKETLIRIYNEMMMASIDPRKVTKEQMRMILMHYISNKKLYTVPLRTASEMAGLSKAQLLNVVNHTFLGGYGYFDEFTRLQQVVAESLATSGLTSASTKQDIISWVDGIIDKEPKQTADILKQLYLSIIYSFCYNRLQSKATGKLLESKSNTAPSADSQSADSKKASTDFNLVAQVVKVVQNMK